MKYMQTIFVTASASDLVTAMNLKINITINQPEIKIWSLNLTRWHLATQINKTTQIPKTAALIGTNCPYVIAFRSSVDRTAPSGGGTEKSSNLHFVTYCKALTLQIINFNHQTFCSLVNLKLGELPVISLQIELLGCDVSSRQLVRPARKTNGEEKSSLRSRLGNVAWRVNCDGRTISSQGHGILIAHADFNLTKSVQVQISSQTFIVT